MLRKFNPIAGLALVIVLALTLSFVGCQKSDEGTSAITNQGKVTIKLTDSPFPLKWFTEVNVTITKIQMHAVDSTKGASFITIWEGRQTVNLLDLRNGKTSDFPEAEVPAGKYNMIRMKVDSVHIKYKNGMEFSLNMPDNCKAGIKIMIVPPLEVEEGTLQEVLLDFDVSKSIMIRSGWHGNFPMPGFFRFRPFIRAVSMKTTGSIMGFVSDTSGVAIADAQISVKADTVVTNAFSNRRGYFKAMGLPEGTYSVKVEKEGYQPKEADNVTVVKRQATIQNFELIPQ